MKTKNFMTLCMCLVIILVCSGIAGADSKKITNPENDHIYQRIDTAMLWNEAKLHCQNMGGYLATITSQTENNFIYNKFGNESMWLGGTDETEFGVWQWITGEEWNYTNWVTGQPDGNNEQNYLQMWEGHNGQWDNDGPPRFPSRTHKFVCEWNQNPTNDEFENEDDAGSCGLIAYYPFDGNADDKSGKVNDGDIVGSIEWIEGKIGSAISLNGSDAYIAIPEPGDYPEATIGGWIKWRSFNVWSRFFDFGKREEAIHVANRMYTDTLAYDCHFHSETNIYTNAHIEKDRWYHIMMVISNISGAKLYVDGQLISETPSMRQSLNDLAADANFYLGKSNWSGDGLLDGVIDEFRIYNCALSESEISELYNQNNYECNEDDSGYIDIKETTGPCGGKVTIPVRVQNAPNTVNSMGFDVIFDSDVLTYAGFDKGDMTEEFDFFNVSKISDGLVRCGGFTAEELAEGSEGDLVYLNFDVSDKCHDSRLELRNLKDDISTWTASHGCFGMKCTGDVNQDGEITPKDALCAFEKYLQICPTSCGVQCEKLCCDVNADGECTPADGFCIFRKYLGMSGCLDE